MARTSRFPGFYKVTVAERRALVSDATGTDARDIQRALEGGGLDADTADRQSGLYRKDCDTVAHKVREWAITNGNNQLLRIALCGYDGEHEMPDEWECVAWNAGEGFGGQAKQRTNNGKRERIWFSPACLKAEVKQEMLL